MKLQGYCYYPLTLPIFNPLRITLSYPLSLLQRLPTLNPRTKHNH